MRLWLYCTLVAILLVFPRTGWAQTATGVSVKAVKLTVLSTMLVGTNPSAVSTRCPVGASSIIRCGSV
jgi:hypothetical protein